MVILDLTLQLIAAWSSRRWRTGAHHRVEAFVQALLRSALSLQTSRPYT
jgi:hypothetical protein